MLRQAQLRELLRPHGRQGLDVATQLAHLLLAELGRALVGFAPDEAVVRRISHPPHGSGGPGQPTFSLRAGNVPITDRPADVSSCPANPTRSCVTGDPCGTRTARCAWSKMRVAVLSTPAGQDGLPWTAAARTPASLALAVVRPSSCWSSLSSCSCSTGAAHCCRTGPTSCTQGSKS